MSLGTHVTTRAAILCSGRKEQAVLWKTFTPHMTMRKTYKQNKLNELEIKATLLNWKSTTCGFRNDTPGQLQHMTA